MEEAKLDIFSARRTVTGKTAAETWMEEMDVGLPNATLSQEEEPLIKRESDVDSDDGDIQGAVGKERKPQKIRKREKMESAKVFRFFLNICLILIHPRPTVVVLSTDQLLSVCANVFTILLVFRRISDQN